MSTYCKRRRRLTAEERKAREVESLARVRNSLSLANYAPVIEEFAARGIPVDQIEPKVNVLTYNAWRALGRQVRKGEKSVKLAVWYPIEDSREEPASDGSRPRRLRCVTSCVFHISQTDLIGEGGAA